MSKSRDYARGYNAGRRGAWPEHKLPAPPRPLVARAMAAAKALRDAVDGEIATWWPEDEPAKSLGKKIDDYDRAAADIGQWLAAGDVPVIEVRQQDWIPGFAAYAAGSGAEGPAHVALNVGSLVTMVAMDELPASELPYIVAESIMHEVVHVLEEWAGVEFSEDRVEALIEAYRAKYAPPPATPTPANSQHTPPPAHP